MKRRYLTFLGLAAAFSGKDLGIDRTLIAVLGIVGLIFVSVLGAYIAGVTFGTMNTSLGC